MRKRRKGGYIVIGAVIFDMDGVLSDTQWLHEETQAAALARRGIVVDHKELGKRFSGVPNRDWLAILCDEYHVPRSVIPGLLEEFERSFLSEGHGKVRAIEGARELVASLRRAGVPLALVSGSNSRVVAFVLAELELADAFKVVVTSDDPVAGKPSPAPFLLAAERLGVAPEGCVVIEDGVSGMVGARKAGMKAVALAPPGERGLSRGSRHPQPARARRGRSRDDKRQDLGHLPQQPFCSSQI